MVISRNIQESEEGGSVGVCVCVLKLSSVSLKACLRKKSVVLKNSFDS